MALMEHTITITITPNEALEDMGGLEQIEALLVTSGCAFTWEDGE